MGATAKWIRKADFLLPYPVAYKLMSIPSRDSPGSPMSADVPLILFINILTSTHQFPFVFHSESLSYLNSKHSIYLEIFLTS